MRKKWLALTSFIVAVMLFFTGCSLPESIHNSLQEWVDSENARIEADSDYMTADKYAKIMINQVLECFINKDKETLISLFSEDMQENYSDLDLYIDLAFEFLDGEVETYDEPFGGGYGAYSKKYIDGSVTLYTDKGTEYTIRLDGYYRYDEYPNETGLFYVVLANQMLYEELKAEGLNASALAKDTSWKVPIG